MPKNPTFEILTPLKGLNILSKPVADPDLLKAFSTANYLVGGEFLVLDGANQAERPSADPSVDEVGPYALFTEHGRSDTQASGKVPLVMSSGYVARTKLFVGTPAAGTHLEVQQDTYDGQTRSVLGALTSGKDVGYVMEPVDADGWLKIMVTA
jgi:hypothetical protein